MSPARLCSQSLVQSLLDLRESHSELTAVVLDTLGSLALDDKTQNDNLFQLLASVSSASEMPSVVSFILQQAGTRAVNPSDSKSSSRDSKLSLQDIVDKLRAGLNHSQLVGMSEAVSSHQARNKSGGGGFKSRQPGQHARRGEQSRSRAGTASAASSTSLGGLSGTESDMAAPFLVFDSLRQGFRHHPAIAAAWFKSLAMQSKPSKKKGAANGGSSALTDEIFVADVWAMLLLFATPMRNQAGDWEGKVLKLMRDKITRSEIQPTREGKQVV